MAPRHSEWNKWYWNALSTVTAKYYNKFPWQAFVLSHDKWNPYITHIYIYDIVKMTFKLSLECNFYLHLIII